MVLGQAIGRIGCIVNGCSYGVPTTSPLAFIYVDPDSMVPRSLLGTPTQPVPLYELVGNLVIFALLWRLRGRLRADGALFLVYAVLYSAMRFGTGFLRQEAFVMSGLQQSQLIALAVVALAAALLVYRWRSTGRAEQAAIAQVQ